MSGMLALFVLYLLARSPFDGGIDTCPEIFESIFALVVDLARSPAPAPRLILEAMAVGAEQLLAFWISRFHSLFLTNLMLTARTTG